VVSPGAKEEGKRGEIESRKRQPDPRERKVEVSIRKQAETVDK